MRLNKFKVSRLASWSVFFGLLLTVGTGFNPGSLRRDGCEMDPEVLEHLRELNGLVRAAGSQTPIGQATLHLDDKTALSNDQGQFQFMNVPFGSHTLTIDVAGYVPFEQTILVNAATGPLTIDLQSAVRPPVELPVADAYTDGFPGSAITNFGEDPFLLFDGTDVTLSGEAKYYSFIQFDLAGIPAGATIDDVILFSSLLEPSRPAPGRLGTLGTADEEAIPLEAFAVLDTWDESDINYLNQPRNLLIAPVATGTIPANPTGDELVPFTLDLTAFARIVQAGQMQTHGFVLTAVNPRSGLNQGSLYSITSSEYEPAESRLHIVAHYTQVNGQKAEVVLR